MKGNHRNPQPVTPVYNRKFARNKMKRAIGSNEIRQMWRRSQIRLLELKGYVKMRSSKTPRNHRKEVAYQLYNGL